MTPRNAPLPKSIAHFDVVRRLGEGGMAEVFLAKKGGAEGTFKLLVVKRILPTHGASRRFRAMFIEEAQLATRLNHPNVVQVFEFLDAGDEGLLLAMEYVEGPDLGVLLSSAKARSSRLSPWVGAWIIGEAAKGLHYAHAKKDDAGHALEIVHRDVSPQNVLLSFEGAVKIADFGIASARLFDDDPGILKGKFGYMSPEQARGERVDARSDIYSLGVIFWEVLTGRPLHGGLGGEALLDVVRSGYVEPPREYVPDIPPELERIVMRALEPDPAHRYASCREMGAEIARSLFAHEQLIDSSTLEAAIADFVQRRHTSPGVAPPDTEGSPSSVVSDRDAHTIAAAPQAKSEIDSAADPDAIARSDGDGAKRRAAGPWEVRHVAVTALKLHGLDDYAAADPQGASRLVQRLRTMLGDIAFKRGSRVWIWSSVSEAHAIAGLTTNPGRAAFDAALLALETHEALSGMAEGLPVSLSASVAVVRGMASGSRDARGNLVRARLHPPADRLAALVLGRVPARATWVAGGIFRIVRRDFRWDSTEEIKLADDERTEGIPARLRAHVLVRSLSREEKREVLATATDLVGRDAERADLMSAYHHAVNAGNTGAITCRAIVGEIGVGKSALVEAFRAELPPQVRCVHIEASRVTMELPLRAVTDIARQLIGTTGEEPILTIRKLVSAGAGGGVDEDVIAQLAAIVSDRPNAEHPELDERDARKQIVVGMRAILQTAARKQPVVVIVDGLHWVDTASLQVLGELTKSQDSVPVLFLFVSRADDRVQALLSTIVRIQLDGLSIDEQFRLVETRIGVEEGVREACADLLPRVGGNPFFLIELVDALLERGALEVRDDGETGNPRLMLSDAAVGDRSRLALPSTLEQLLGDRLRELPEEEHRVVDWLAVAGTGLVESDLVTIAAIEDESVVGRLCARGLCDRRGGEVHLKHPLTRDVAYRALDKLTRVQMHRALGERLIDTALAQGVSAAIVAGHFDRGLDQERAAALYLEAANAARRSHQALLAIRNYRRALACMNRDEPARFVAHEALEAIYRSMGRRRERVEQLDALRQCGKSLKTNQAVIVALLRMARFDLDEGRLARGLPLAKDAARIARDAGLVRFEVEAEALTSELSRELGDVQNALAACDRALGACDGPNRDSVPARTRADVLRARGVLLRRVGRVREAVDAYVDAIAVFRRAGARRREARTKNALAYAMFVQSRYEDAIALALESIQLDLSFGGRFQLAKTLTNIGQSYAKLGDSERALAYLQRAQDAHTRFGDQDGRTDTLLVFSELLVTLGHLEQASRLLEDAKTLAAVTNNAYDLVHADIVSAVLLRLEGRQQEALAHAQSARERAEEQSLVAFQFYAMAVQAAITVELGERHKGTLLATTALGAVQNLQGCEYGLEIRAVVAEALARAESPQADHARNDARDHAIAIWRSIRSRRFKASFAQRAMVASLIEDQAASLARSGAGGAASTSGEIRQSAPPRPSPSDGGALPPSDA